MASFRVRSGSRRELVDVTRQVSAHIPSGEGAALLWVPHTTAALTVNEGFDPDVALDIAGALERISPRDAPHRHSEGNSDAHVLATVIGPDLLIPCRDGLRLGRWQKVFLVELDGPRERTVRVSFLPGGDRS